MTVSVCVFVCVCLYVYLENHVAELHHRFSVACCCGSVLLLLHTDTLCTSGLVDRVVFYGGVTPLQQPRLGVLRSRAPRLDESFG